VFGNVDNHSVIAQEEIFGPVLSVIPAVDEDDAVRIANDTIYGLNASVFTSDVNRARQVAARLRSGTVGHNAMRTDFGVSFGGYKQSGIGREGVHEGLAPLLEVSRLRAAGTARPFGLIVHELSRTDARDCRSAPLNLTRGSGRQSRGGQVGTGSLPEG
jgi:aldehyde dehydrogenase (NAD+)